MKQRNKRQSTWSQGQLARVFPYCELFDDDHAIPGTERGAPLVEHLLDVLDKQTLDAVAFDDNLPQLSETGMGYYAERNRWAIANLLIDRGLDPRGGLTVAILLALDPRLGKDLWPRLRAARGKLPPAVRECLDLAMDGKPLDPTRVREVIDGLDGGPAERPAQAKPAQAKRKRDRAANERFIAAYLGVQGHARDTAQQVHRGLAEVHVVISLPTIYRYLRAPQTVELRDAVHRRLVSPT